MARKFHQVGGFGELQRPTEPAPDRQRDMLPVEELPAREGVREKYGRYFEILPPEIGAGLELALRKSEKLKINPRPALDSMVSQKDDWPSGSKRTAMVAQAQLSLLSIDRVLDICVGSQKGDLEQIPKTLIETTLEKAVKDHKISRDLQGEITEAARNKPDPLRQALKKR